LKITNQIFNKKSGLIVLCGLLLFIGLVGTMAIDMYVPSLPYISRDFSISSELAKYTITFYLISYGVGQLIYGPLSDSFGRKGVLLITAVIGFMGSLLCVTAPSISMLYVGRFLQGAGYSGVSVVGPVIARDVLNDKRFAQVASVLSLIFGLGPVCSPVLGGYIDYLFGWRMVFGVISIYTLLVMLLIIFVIPETHDKNNRSLFHVTVVLKTWRSIITNKIFITNMLCKSLAFTGFIVFYTVTPFMFQNHLGLNSVQYGWITLGLTGAILSAKLTNMLTLNYISIEKLNFFSTALLAFSGGLLLLFALLNAYSLAAILIPFTLFGIGSGFLFSNTTAAAFKPFKGVSSGSVSGLLSGLQLLSAFLGSAIAAHLGLKSLMPLGVFMAVLGVSVLAQYIFFNRKESGIGEPDLFLLK
jgi:DHA1 family 2-module integral membrane pump EmrD-like MFS transporter